MSENADQTLASIKRHMQAGIAAVVFLAVGVGGWAATTEFAGAVISPGALVVDSSLKKIQHPTGGVVGQIAVTDGQKVAAGQLLVRLDETVARVNLAILTKSLDEFYARQARLEAERDGSTALQYPDILQSRKADDAVARIMAGESNLFELRRTARAGQKMQLSERKAQLAEEIRGLSNQIEAKRNESRFIARELEGVRDLLRRNLIQLPRVTALERDAARIDGEAGQLTAAVAQTKVKISETELQIIQVDQDLRSEVAKELREIQAKIAELVERKVSAEDQMARIELRAPLAGVVHQLAVHTVGGVVGPGEVLMMIVPEKEELVVEVKLPPNEIDQVRPEQEAFLRLSAFNQRTTPELNGKVVMIAGDLTTDQRSGQSYYAVRISIPKSEVARLDGLRLVPGMPVEAFIKAENRTVLSFLIKPLSDQLMKAWREK
ncbi:HlyD family type I secretion periplasmic adaptor subunit [Alsobacter metallidurans]|uniref:Membrane fusion protein (MFP) family protein n=1 Tax=Alsobacter metallidurans TaxID=340221 RepID=A0A917MGU3_9HYPH|nr:HlyD family type I secretion periplasmic adaptor subunit [Alsobacter metallidurans]GGH17197.1 HlyD family type I secretion periplasmic adaptor subunit [Alsobacter metallidurans]